MKISTERVSKQLQHPAVLIGVVVLVAYLLAGPGKDEVRKSLLKTGFVAVLIAAALRLALGVVGWPLWLLAGGAFVASGAAGDVAESLGLSFGSGSGSSGTENIYEAAAQACATHGGLSGGASILTSPYRRCLCNDGTFQSF